MKTKQLLMLLAGCLTATLAPAQNAPDAKTLGMGSVAIPAVDTTHPVFGNPSSVAFATPVAQLSTSYYSQDELDYYAVSGYWNIDTYNIVEAGWTRSTQMGDKEMKFSAGYVRRIGDRTGVGIVGHYLRFGEGDEVQNALAVDLSVLYARPMSIFGRYATLRLGGKVGYLGGYTKSRSDLENYMPLSATVGAALDTHISEGHELTVGFDLGECFVPKRLRATTFHLGAEYSLMQLLQFRAGYLLTDRIHTDAAGQATVGLGARIMHLRIDAAYIFGKDRLALKECFCLSFGLDF